MAKTDEEDVSPFTLFTWIEMGVFSLEDRAAVLVLAKSTRSPNIIELISTYLTVTCGVIYILYVKGNIDRCWALHEPYCHCGYC